MPITHAKVSSATEGPDDEKVRTSDWNADHNTDAFVIEDLSDVDVTTVPPEDGQGLIYDAASSTWKPGAAGGGAAISAAGRIYAYKNFR